VFTVRYVLHSTSCPHSVFMYFVRISERIAIISLYTIDWLALVMAKRCVLCEGELETFTLCTDAQTQTLSSLLILLHISVPHPSQSLSTLYNHQSAHLPLSLLFLPDRCPAHSLRRCLHSHRT